MYSLNIDLRDCSEALQKSYDEYICLAFLEQYNGFSVLRLGHHTDFYRCTGHFDSTVFEKHPYCSLSGERMGKITLSCFNEIRKCIIENVKWIPDPTHQRAPVYQMEFKYYNVWEGDWNVSFEKQTVHNAKLVDKTPVWDITCEELQITKDRMVLKFQGIPSRTWSISGSDSQNIFAYMNTGDSRGTINLKCTMWYTEQNRIRLLVHTCFDRPFYDSISGLFLNSVPTVIYTLVRKQL